MKPHPVNPKRTPEILEARMTLRNRGWNQTSAARHLGVSAVHLCYVLNGRRTSRRMLTAIRHLPSNPNPA